MNTSRGQVGEAKSLQAIDAEANWHPSGWSMVFTGGDTLSATARSLAGFTTLKRPQHALAMVYRPPGGTAFQPIGEEGSAIVVGQVVRGVLNGYFVWVVVEGNPSSLPDFFRI